MRAAVPAYVGSDFGDCPPGHRFGLYFPVWTDDWRIEKEQKSTALKQILRLPPHAQDALLALGERQALLLNNFPAEARLTLEAKSSSPFATGLGMEHPLENGFAFLNPHGLPYLPGSGVKGVLRRASQELNWDEATQISLLFGRATENQETDHLRGALSFWDVLPKPAGNTMEMDVMTPHQGAYYQGASTPHDSGQPTPIFFLVVPAGSEFSFHVTCDTARLPEDLRNSWQDLLRAGFAYAFDWLGFGAKTAVGYGAMERDKKAESDREAKRRRREEIAREEQAKREELENLTPAVRAIHEFLAIRPDKNQSEISTVIAGMKQGTLKLEKQEVANWLMTKMQDAKEWKEVSQAKKPEKDKTYQNTLLVKQWLQGN